MWVSVSDQTGSVAGCVVGRGNEAEELSFVQSDLVRSAEPLAWLRAGTCPHTIT